MEEELKQEDWEVQTTSNEEDIDVVIDGGDENEATDDVAREEQ